MRARGAFVPAAELRVVGGSGKRYRLARAAIAVANRRDHMRVCLGEVGRLRRVDVNRDVFQRETRLDAHIHLRLQQARAPLAQARTRFLVIPAQKLDVVIEHAELFGVEYDELTGEEEP